MMRPERHARLVRALLVDDEALARRRLRTLLADDSRIEIVGEADSGTAAVKLLRELDVDLVFLDIQMPGLDGFGVLRAVPADELPLVVFITAYDEHAVKAFDVSAVDYVLKPVVESRFRLAVDRATHIIREAMGDFEQRVSGSRFLRIHRSRLVNLDRVKEVQPWFKGDFVLILHDGTRLVSGRTYRERVRELLR